MLPGDDSVREAIDEARARLNVGGTLHFANIRSSAQKLSAFKALAGADFISLVVASDAHAWYRESGPGRHAATHYRYVLSHLLQRATVLAGSLGLELDLIIEDSRHASIESIRSYVELLSTEHSRDRGRRFADWERLNPNSMRMAPKHQEPLLSAADGIAHAYYKALTVDPKLGTAEPH